MNIIVHPSTEARKKTYLKSPKKKKEKIWGEAVIFPFNSSIYLLQPINCRFLPQPHQTPLFSLFVVGVGKKMRAWWGGGGQETHQS